MQPVSLDAVAFFYDYYKMLLKNHILMFGWFKLFSTKLLVKLGT